jgi:hypothetical protein
VGLFAFYAGLTLARGAEDPGRFLRVTNWFATFTHTLNVNGDLSYTEPNTEDSCSANWHFNHSMTVSCQLALDPQTANHPYFRTFIWKQNESFNVHLSDLFERTCVNSQGESSYHSYTVDDVGLSPTNFALLLDTSTESYSVAWVGVQPPVTSKITYDDFSAPGQIGILWSPDALSSNSLPAAGMTLSGQESISFPERYLAITPAAGDFVAGDSRFGGTHPLGPSKLSGNLVLTWSLTPQVEELEVIVEPQGYADWIPKGKLNSLPIRGNSIRVSARLQKKGGGEPQASAESFRFTLANVSKMPGICMNFPQKDPSDERDLKFEEELNLPRAGTANTINEDQTELEIGALGTDVLRTAVATVSSFDFGAYGEIRVEANVPGYHDPIVGHLKNETTTKIPIPKSKAGSHIALRWLEQNGGQSSSVFDDTDQDGFPEGDGHRGDGLSLYEEYRGFSVGRTHVRTRPVIKDLFIRDEVRGAEALSAILQFKSASRLEVHHKLDKDEISPDGVINFNHDWAHNLDQHGLILVGRQQKTGASSAVNRPGVQGNSTPGSKIRIEMEPMGTGWGLDLSAVVGGGGALEYTQFAFRDIAHEIGHGCSVWHHGDCDIWGDVGLRWLEAADGSHIETRNVGGSISQTPITILNPDGSQPRLVFSIDPQTQIRYQKRYFMAVPQGQHSGDVFCIMTYDVADCFRRDLTDKRYLNLKWPAVQQSRLCTSAEGTGVNAAGTPGGPWLGDAYQAKNRGNCAGQICVNDLYLNDAKHKRAYACPPW